MPARHAKTTNVKQEEGQQAATTATATPLEQPMVIPVIQEEVIVNKQVVETGRVRISKQVREYEELVDVPLLREQVAIERVPVNLFVEQRPPVRQEGDTMIIPVVEERVIVQKKLLLVEELRVRKQMIETHQPQTVNLLKEEVEIKRVAANQNFNP